jgi:hypothetical protein
VTGTLGTIFDAGLERLKDECALPGYGFAPHERQTLSAVPRMLRAELDGPARRLVVLAVDGLRYDDARRSWPQARVSPCTATFPSTSIAGWTTSLTGQPVGRHGLAGPVLRDPVTGRTRNLLDGAGDRPSGSGGETVFEALARSGTTSIAVLGGLEPYRNSGWLTAMMRGAHVSRCDGERPGSAVETVRDAFRAVDAVLREHADSPSTVVWCHVDLDFFVHSHGYDRDLHTALTVLDDLAARRCDDRTTVLAYADHGLTESEHDAELTRFWSEFNHQVGTDAPGGAGRAAWCYPEAAREDHARSVLEAELGPDFRCLHLEEAVSLGLLGPGPAAAARSTVGRIVVLPVGRRYLCAAGGSRFEHGSLTEDEIFVPVARWAPH